MGVLKYGFIPRAAKNPNEINDLRAGAVLGSAPYGPYGADPLYTTAPVGYGADPPYMPTAQRPPAVPPVVTGGIEGVGSNS
jgi:hypothetical protein